MVRDATRIAWEADEMVRGAEEAADHTESRFFVFCFFARAPRAHLGSCPMARAA